MRGPPSNPGADLARSPERAGGRPRGGRRRTASRDGFPADEIRLRRRPPWSYGPSISTFLPRFEGTTRILPRNARRTPSPPRSRSRNTASAATSEWGWFPTATLNVARSKTARGTFSAPTTRRRFALRGIRGRTSSRGSPYIVRCTIGPSHPRRVSRHGTPVRTSKGPPNLAVTERSPRSNPLSLVETRTASAPNARAVRATWVVTRLSRAGRWPSRRTAIVIGSTYSSHSIEYRKRATEAWATASTRTVMIARSQYPAERLKSPNRTIARTPITGPPGNRAWLFRRTRGRIRRSSSIHRYGMMTARRRPIARIPVNDGAPAG